MNYRISYIIISLSFFFILIFSSCKEVEERRMYFPAIAHTWTVKPIETDKSGSFVSGPLVMSWETSEDIMLGDEVEGVKPADAATFITKYGSYILAQALKDVTLGEDYDISATYSDEISFDISNPVTPNWKDSGTGYAKYKEVSNKKKLLILLDMDKITNGNKELESKINSLPILKNLITNGIPVSYETTSDQKNIYFWIDAALAKQLLPLVVSIVPAIKDEDFGGRGNYIRFLLGNIEEVMELTTKFDIIMKMTK